MTKKRWQRALKYLIICLMIWGVMIAADYLQVIHNHEKPVFAHAALTADDGGSGLYRGIGYEIVLKGNFMPEEDNPGVTYAAFYLFSDKIKTVERN